MTEEVTQIVKGIIQELDNSMLGSYDANTGRTYVCNTKWLRVGKIVTNDNGVEYIVTELVSDQYIVAEPVTTGPALDGWIYINLPYWITGTKISANREWTIASNNIMDKTPIVWLLEMVRYKAYGRENTKEWESELRLFILDETDVTNFYVEDHRINVVLPMEKLANEVIESVNNNKTFQRVDEYDVYSFSRFGVEKDNGVFQNILDANLSGIELRFTLVKYKGNCKC